MVNVDNIGDTVQILLHSAVKNNHTHQSSPSISMVPRTLREVNPKSFSPRVVSIGPLHRKDEVVVAFEAHKATYMHDLLRRLESPPEETLRACVEKVDGSINKIRGCYVGMEPCSDVELAKIMVMDACFILQFCHKLSTYHSNPLLVGSAGEMNALLCASVTADLLLVENQIPLFVLRDIFECTLSRVARAVPLFVLIGGLLEFGNIFKFETRLNIENAFTNIKIDHAHILGLLHKCYEPHVRIHAISRRYRLRSVVELEMAGVDFKPNRDANWPLEMKLESSRSACSLWFMVKPTLKMPRLIIDEYTESCLRNLIAYEQSFSNVDAFVTAYTVAMDMLIDTPEDIRILVESKAVDNDFGTNEEAANMMNNIFKGAVFSSFSYFGQSDELDSYYNSWWPKRIAWVRRTYFNSPWNLIAVVAGIMLFVLTLLQTIYTIRA